MKFSKRLVAFLCAVLLVVACSSCSSSTKDNGKIKVVATIFPQYDWTRQITKGSNNIDVSLLLDKGVDMHSYKPSVEDMVKIKDADVLIYVGGESDTWVQEAIEDNKNLVAIDLMKALGNNTKTEEAVDGKTTDEKDTDEHIWLSIKNAIKLCRVISNKLVAIDKSNASLYKNNAESYVNILKGYDKKYTKVTSKSKIKTLIFADRFPFRYLVDDYHLKYYAAYVGCSAETEASFATITRLVQDLNKTKLHYLMVTESSDKKMAETIVANTKTKNQKICVLDSMQSVSSNDIKKGITYVKYLEKNLKVLRKVLS